MPHFIKWTFYHLLWLILGTGVQRVSGQDRFDSIEVHFALAQSIPYRSEFDKVTDRLNQLHSHGVSVQSIEISGHADSIGNMSYNKGLSTRRANFVIHLLQSMPINDSVRFNVQSLGESSPIHFNDTLNRVVMVRVTFSPPRENSPILHLSAAKNDTVISLPLISFVEDAPNFNGRGTSGVTRLSQNTKNSTCRIAWW